jgi:hypothetical protein
MTMLSQSGAGRVLAACAFAFAAAAPAQAVTYDLAADWSDAVNPNGPWSYTQGATPLSHFAQPTDGNALNAAAGNGYWGAGPAFTNSPFLIRTTQNGGATPTYSDGDFLAGDVIVHGTNPGAGSPVFINWTAAAAGKISFDSSIWYAHSPVTRAAVVTALLNGTSIGSATVANGVTRSSALSLNGSSLDVAAGDVLAFRFEPAAGQSFGSLTGITLTVDFEAAPAIPEPASWALMIVGFAIAGAAARSQSRVRFA